MDQNQTEKFVNVKTDRIDPVGILGIPVNNLTMEETIQSILSIVDQSRLDHQSRYIATVNVDFITNTLGWKHPNLRHPELYRILSKADLTTADGMPLVWLSKLLGYPLKERVTGADMAIELAEASAKQGYSLFFFGGDDRTAKKAADILCERFPSLDIKGTLSPMIHIEGDKLGYARRSDDEIISAINNSGADILFIGMGNPKQEIWFERIKHHLKVPVSIGLGGSYAFITGAVKRSPKWMQKAGLEWVYRLFQEPKRLWKRYAMGLAKYSWLSTQVLLKDLSYKVIQRCSSSSNSVKKSFHEIITSSNDSIYYSHITLPIYVTGTQIQQIVQELNSRTNNPFLILDLKQTRYLDCGAQAILNSIWNAYPPHERKIFFCHISPNLMNQSPIWLNLKSNLFPTLESFIHFLGSARCQEKFHTDYLIHDGIHLYAISGRFDSGALEQASLPSEMERLQGNWIINLSHCELIDNGVIAFLVEWKNQLESNGGRIILSGVNPTVRQLIHLAKVEQHFQLIQEVSVALEHLSKDREKLIDQTPELAVNT